MQVMLAGKCVDANKLRFPVLATPKIDGIRAFVLNGKLQSRWLKPIPNRHITQTLQHVDFEGFDGELFLNPIQVDLLTPPREPTFQEVTSAVSSEDGKPNFVFRVFDLVGVDAGYSDRMEIMRLRANHLETRYKGIISFLFPVPIGDLNGLVMYTVTCLANGDEGVMIRTPDSPYKHGRSTFKEQYLIKIKPVEDAEAKIIGFEEQMHNANEATVSELGRTERSSHQSGMVPKGTLGAFVCECASGLWKETFKVGTGLDDATRSEVWNNQSKYLGEVIKYKYQKIGSKDRPRQPVFHGFRSAIDRA